MKLPLLFIVILLLTSNALAKKKKKAKKEKPIVPADDSKMFDSKTLKCLVCQNVVKEFEAAIFKVDPKKVIDTGTFRVNEKGEQKRQVVSLGISKKSKENPLYCVFILYRFHLLDRKSIY